MIEQSLQITRPRLTIHLLKGRDILSFWVLVSLVYVYALDTNIPEYSKAAVIVVSFLLLLVHSLIMNRKFDSLVVIWGIYAVWLCVSNSMNSRDLIMSVYYPAKVMTFIMLNKLYLDKRDTSFLRIMRHYLTVLLIINFLLQMIAQEMFGYTLAHNHINFFESDNYLCWYYTPYIALCIILDFIEEDRIRKITYMEIGLCFASIMRAWVGKALIGLAVIILYILFVYRKGIAKFFIPKILILGYLVINVGVVFFGIQSLVSMNLYNLLGKDMTISGRTVIWASALLNIRKSLVWGHGVTRGAELSINRGPNGGLMPAHNIFLEVAVQAGVVGLLIYLAMLAVAFYKGRQGYMKDKKYQNCNYEYLFLAFMIFIIYFMAIFSHPVYIPFFYLPLILFSSFDSLVDMHEQRKCQRRQI